MKRFIVLFTLLSLGVFVAMLPGCSTNDSVSNLIQGDTTAAEFQFVQNVVGQQGLEGFGKISDLSFDLVDSIPGATFSPKNSRDRQASAAGNEIIVFDSLNYAWDGVWHVFSFAAYITDTVLMDTIDISGVDSLQTLSNGMSIQVPDSTMDELRARASIMISERNGTFTASGIHSINVTGITPLLIDPVTINGSSNESFSGTDTDSSATCDFTFSNTLNANNVVLSIEGLNDCPISGSVSLAATIDLFCVRDLGTSVDTVTVAGGWSVSGVFASDGTIAVTYSDGTTVWSTVETCTPSASPIARWTRSIN